MKSLAEDSRALLRKISPSQGTSALRDKQDAAFVLCSCARRYARIQERWCSEEMTDDTIKRLERTESLLERRMSEAAEKLGATTLFGGDPRGNTVKLQIPGHENLYDCWGRQGVCVPGS